MKLRKRLYSLNGLRQTFMDSIEKRCEIVGTRLLHKLI